MKNGEKFKTADERIKAFGKWHEKFCGMRGVCAKDDVCAYTVFHWLDLEAEAEKPLPCPLCGLRMGVHGALLRCTGCGFTVAYGLTTNDVTSAFNRIAKAVMESGNEGDK